jgi:ubiquitin-protein ligase
VSQIVLGVQDLLNTPNLDDPAQVDAYALLKCVLCRQSMVSSG